MGLPRLVYHHLDSPRELSLDPASLVVYEAYFSLSLWPEVGVYSRLLGPELVLVFSPPPPHSLLCSFFGRRWEVKSATTFSFLHCSRFRGLQGSCLLGESWPGGRL